MSKIFSVKAVHILSAAGAVFFILLLFLYADPAKKGAYEGILASGEIVIPSLFPFMAASLFLTRVGIPRFLSFPLDKIFGLLFRDRSGSGVLLSFLSGFPVGGKIIAEEYENGRITAAEATAKLTYSVNSGPAFMITAVGVGMLHAQDAGILIFCAVTLAAVLNGVFYAHLLVERPFKQSRTTAEKPAESPGSAFVGSVGDTAVSMIQISGFVVLFSTITSILGEIVTNKRALLAGSQLLEVTVGCIFNQSSALPVIAAGIGFGGLSVIFQVLFCIRKVPVNRGVFLLSRVTHALLSYILTKAALMIYPLSAPAMLSTGIPSPASEFSIPLTLAMGLMSVTLICYSQTVGDRRRPDRSK